MKLRRFMVLGNLIFILFSYSPFNATCRAQALNPSSVKVNLVTDEADAVLSILAKKRDKQTLTEADWQRLFTSEGYVRLKQREAAMQRAFVDEEFKFFVLSDKLSANATALLETLKQWRRTSVAGATRRALAYLPKDAQISAKVYPVIKPRENSFVFEVNTDPAIFLYLDPSRTREQFENTLAHELHHIGYGGSCPSKRMADEISRLPPNLQNVMTWVGAFGEGFAMLAAAGGLNTHPHAFSKPEDRARWDRDMLNFNVDLKRVEQFFLKMLNNQLSEDERQKEGFSFFGTQGPWYTVGWKMAVVIEKIYGRANLIECICDQRRLLSSYNRAAAEYNRHTVKPLALWSPTMIEAMRRARNRLRRSSSE